MTSTAITEDTITHNPVVLGMIGWMLPGLGHDEYLRSASLAAPGRCESYAVLKPASVSLARFLLPVGIRQNAIVITLAVPFPIAVSSR